MTKDEVKKLLFTAYACYPNMQKMSSQQMDFMLDAWYMVLDKYDWQTALAGLKICLANDTKGFPPSPGQIIDAIGRIEETKDDELTDLEAWALVSSAIKNSGYNTKAEFDALPPLVRKAVGSPSNLREMGMMPTELVNSGEQTRFCNTYRTVVARSKADKKIPLDVMALIEAKKKEFAALDDKKPQQIESHEEPEKESKSDKHMDAVDGMLEHLYAELGQ